MSKSIKAVIDDGFNAELVETAFFDGILEIPVIKPVEQIVIPDHVIPYSKINQSKDHSEFVLFYEMDTKFADVLRDINSCYEKIKDFPGVITIDPSLYRDSPLTVQIGNTYRNRAFGCYMQSKGMYVVTNVRWGDERSYTTKFLPEKLAFLGTPKDSIVSIGTYGCIKGKENVMHFKNGLAEMLDELHPQVVLVYGAMPDSIFADFKDRTKFVNYRDWTSEVRRNDHGDR